MSKKIKKAQKAKNAAAKRARRDANRDMYQRWAADGNNQKDKTKGRAKKRRLVNTTSHKNGGYLTNPCGNLGCKHCHPEYNVARTA